MKPVFENTSMQLRAVPHFSKFIVVRNLPHCSISRASFRHATLSLRGANSTTAADLPPEEHLTQKLTYKTFPK